MKHKETSKLNTVSFIGTLPPIKGISPYCLELITAISEYTSLEFIGFSRLYPNFIYPGGKTTEDNVECKTSINDITIRNFLTYYDPLSWIYAGLTIQGNVVHAQWWSSVLAPLYFTIFSICKLRHKKIIITVHNVTPHENNFLNKILDSLILNFGDYFVVHSFRNISELNETFGIPLEKIMRIPIGAFKSYTENSVTSEDARRKLDLPVHNKVILFFGHIRDYKGLEVMLEALIYIKDIVENVTLVVAGSPWVQWEKYDSIIKKNNLERYIRLHLRFIPSSETKYFYNASDLVVLPYKKFAAQSAVGAVALAFKKPLIVTNVGGLPELVKNNNCIVEPNNSKALAEKIILILTDSALYEELSEDAKYVSQEFLWENVAEKTVALYNDILEGKK